MYSIAMGGTLPIHASIFILKLTMLCLHTQIHTHTHIEINTHEHVQMFPLFTTPKTM